MATLDLGSRDILSTTSAMSSSASAADPRHTAASSGSSLLRPFRSSPKHAWKALGNQTLSRVALGVGEVFVSISRGIIADKEDENEITRTEGGSGWLL